MPFFRLGWCGTLVAVLFLVLGGCDIPTGEPSINTETDINTPLVSEKTFSLLGGPESEFDPLIDTTSSEFDSLFAVGDDPKDISIVQEVNNFDIGSLDDALDSASGDLAFSGREFEETFIDLSKFAPFPNQRIGDIPGIDLNVSSSGTIEAGGSNRVAFDKSNNDFVELGESKINAERINVTPSATQRVYEELAFVYPDIRLEPYEEDDSLVVKFVPNPCGQDPCEDETFQRNIKDLRNGFSISVQRVRVFPDKPNVDDSGNVNYDINGIVNEDLVVDDDDQVSLSVTTSVEEFDLRELDVSEVRPFTVEVTSDTDAPGEPGEGDIDIAADDEARISSFDGFENVSDQVDDLELANVSLNATVSTKNLASTDAQVFAAIQGRNETDRLFLAGEQGTERGVSTADLGRFDTDFAENGRPIGAGSLLQLEVNLEDASLGETTMPPPNVIDPDNSNADDFVNALPTEVRLISQAEVNTDGRDLKVREPVELDAGFTLDVPLQIKDQFVLRDTVEADFSDLEDLTDSEENFNISKAELRFRYTNRLPLGADVKMVAVDDEGQPVRTFNENFDDDDFQVDPAPKNPEGGAGGEASGEFVFNLGNTKEELRELVPGRDLRFILNMTQESGGTAARLRADDTLRLDLRLNVEASIKTGD